MLRISSSRRFSIFSLTYCSWVLISSFLSLFYQTDWWCSCYFKSRMTFFCSLTSRASSLTSSNLCACFFSCSIFCCKRACSTTIYLFFLSSSFSRSISICSRWRYSLFFLISKICSAFLRVWSIFLRMRASSLWRRFIRFCKSFSSWSNWAFWLRI